jgi:hypothetical protein
MTAPLQPETPGVGSMVVEPLVPSEDFVNLISEDIAPERYGRAPELDTQDRMIWSEMLWLRRRMRFVAVLRSVLFEALPAAALMVGVVFVLVHLL